jgi:ribosome-associated heat shock protein Hsp15
MLTARMDSTRIDRWLCAARIFKSRTLAHDACEAAQVEINGVVVRASRAVRVGDEVRADSPRGLLVLEVAKLADKRLGAELARELYLDHSPPPPPREEPLFVRERGAGRPTKQERRAIDRLRER